MNIERMKNVSDIYSSTARANANDIFMKPEQDRRRAPRAPKIGKINPDYFKDLMDERQLSLRGLARMMGMSHSQLSQVFRGDRKMQINEAALLSQIFGQPIYSIIENAGVRVQPIGARRAKIVGAAGADGRVVDLREQTTERTVAPDHLPARAIAIQMRTAGTPLAWMDGSIMFCAEPVGVEESAINRLCLVQLKSGIQVLAHVTRGYNPGSYNLTGLFEMQDARIDWACPILLTKHQ